MIVVFITVGFFLFTFIVTMLIEYPEAIPGYKWLEAKNDARALAKQKKNDKEQFKDITALAVSMGYADISEYGWYGFNTDSRAGVVWVGDKRFRYTSHYPRNTADETLHEVLKNLQDSVESHIKAAKKQADLERLVNGPAVIGERSPWVDDK